MPSSDDPVSSRPMLRAGIVALWILVGVQILNLVRHTRRFNDNPYHFPDWDFKVYRAAGIAVAEGRSPFGPGALRSQGIEWPYNYPPILNPILPAFAGEYARVRAGYLAVEILSLALAAFVVIRGLDLKGWRVPAAAWLVVGGGFSAMNLDFNAGNVTAIEMLPAAVFLVGVWRRQSSLIGIGMALLCFAKPTWIVLAVLPLIRDLDRAGLRRAAIAAGAALILPLASLTLFPHETRIWFDTASNWRESFHVNPCLREIIDVIFRRLHAPYATALWAMFVIAFGVAVYRLRRRLPESLGPATISALMLAAPIYFPRLKPYSFAVTALFAVLLLTYSGRSLRAFLPAFLVASFPFLVTYDDDGFRDSFPSVFVKSVIDLWPALLSVLASVMLLRAILALRRGSVPESLPDPLEQGTVAPG